MALSNKVLLSIIFILFVALMLNVFFGCRSFYEGFEAKEMTEEDIKALKNLDPKKASELVQELLKTHHQQRQHIHKNQRNCIIIIIMATTVVVGIRGGRMVFLLAAAAEEEEEKQCCWAATLIRHYH